MPIAPEALATTAAETLWPRPFVVRRVTRETGDTFTLTLEPPEDQGFAFLPGQFNMLYAFGVGEVPISISGDPAQPKQLVHTIRAVGAVTRALQKLGLGDVVGVRGPYGHPWPVDQAQGRDLVIVAGGIGLAPLRPAIEHVLRHRELYGRVVILYGTRTPRDLLYAKELRAWRSRFDVDVAVTVDRAPTGWQGAVGVVTKLVDRSPFDAQSAMAFVCGPEVMIRFTVMALAQRGVSDSSIYVSMERNMKCGVGLCGHCQFGPHFVCVAGPVFRYDEIQPFFGLREV